MKINIHLTYRIFILFLLYLLVFPLLLSHVEGLCHGQGDGLRDPPLGAEERVALHRLVLCVPGNICEDLVVGLVSRAETDPEK